MSDPTFDLLLYHNGSLSGHRMAYIGGDILTIAGIDASQFKFGDLTNILECYLQYEYSNIPKMYYKFDDETNEQIHGLTKDGDFATLKEGLLSSGRKKLHVFVDHEEPLPLEVVNPVLLLTQTPPEVPAVQQTPQEPAAVQHPPQQPRKRPAGRPRKRPVGRPRKQRDKKEEEEEVEDIELSDFELTDGEEEDMFVGKEQDVLREPNDDINTWFQTWDKDSNSGIGVDAANDPDADSYDSEYFDSLDSGEEDSEEDSEGSIVKRKKRYPQWKKKRDWSQTVELSVGLRFTNPKEFKEALQLFAVQNNFDYKYVHNEKKRVTAHCKSLCHWKIHASWTPCRKYFQIKTLHDEHNCGSDYYNKKATIRWAANRYVEIFRDQRSFKARALREMIRRDYNVQMTILSCHRAKKMAIEILDGRDGEQYCHTREYCNALRKWNPGSSAYIQRDGVFFQRMYVSLMACKEGFLAGCRPMICVDACFIKTKWGGQLHAAIGRDGNDDIYPIAFAVCETENKETWTWFLVQLLEDIGLPREHMWSFMSDRQKVISNTIIVWSFLF
jgi:hypothetical protein